MFKREAGAFIIVGLINTAVGISLVYLLYNIFALNYWFSTFIGNAAALILSYVLNKAFTFRQSGIIKHSLTRFFAVVLSCYFVSYWIGLHNSDVLLSIFTGLKGLQENMAILAGAGIYTVTNFVGQKFIVFKAADCTKENVSSLGGQN